MEVNRITQSSIVQDFFHKHPQQDLPVSQVVDWAQDEWERRTNSKLRNPSNILRSLLHKGYLAKPKRGYYRYEPDQVRNNRTQQFSTKQREEILDRDDNRCIVCGMGTREGEDIYVVKFFEQACNATDNIKNSKLKVEDAITLCGKHKNMWLATKNKSPVHNSKSFFVTAYNQAINKSDKNTASFCNDIIKVYEKHGIDGHIKLDR